MASFSFALQVNGLFHNHSISHSFDHLKTLLSSTVKKISLRTDIAKTLKNTSNKMLDAFVDSAFQFVSQTLPPSQKNFTPVEEIGEAVQVVCIEGIIPVDFQAGVYIRNGNSSTSIFEHSGKFYAIAENHLPQEIDIFTLETLEESDVNGAWDRPFTSHPKKAPGTGELVIIGIDGQKPFIVGGVISVILRFDSVMYNVIVDCPLTVDMNRLVAGGPLCKDWGHARYGNADSVKWFDIEANCTLHILNSFEDGNEVVVRGCRALESIISGPDQGLNKFEWFSMGFKPIEISNKNSNGFTREGFLFARVYEWRLNMETGEVKERNLTGTYFSMEFPTINEDFTGVKHKYGYTQVLDSMASSSCGMTKYGGLAKLYFEEQDKTLPAVRSSSRIKHPLSPSTSLRDGKKGQLIKVEYHRFEENNFCSGSAFVPKQGGVEEDDGWIISFVHNEDYNISQVHIIDARKFDSCKNYTASKGAIWLSWNLHTNAQTSLDVHYL
ncbi:hypothetical protein PVL29_014119 [Vitis rotundifolia]|uniref:Uncharacterized protein n=1 Tax=Vitis rotundifolia TaxID=103349 RepID=A0AA38ZFR1_VITRO|nr:hypothetical protein PVL29_014119 [Vitis rotundifolia]